jgi:hypothetical protein
MANRELRELRIKVHDYIDPLWETNRISRRNLYINLSKMIGKYYHTGSCDIKDCKIILNKQIEDFIKWKKFVKIVNIF